MDAPPAPETAPTDSAVVFVRMEDREMYTEEKKARIFTRAFFLP
jgi:hypothetical protein